MVHHNVLLPQATYPRTENHNMHPSRLLRHIFRNVPMFPKVCPAEHYCPNKNQTALWSQVTECIKCCTIQCRAAPAHLENAHILKVPASPTEQNLFTFMKPKLPKSASLHFCLHETPMNLHKQFCQKLFGKMLPYNFSGKTSFSRAQSFVSRVFWNM